MEKFRSSKEQIVDALKILASEREQLNYEENVPHVNITTELQCMWLDDFYHPNHTHFRSSFSSAELSALATFNQFFEKQSRKLPENGDTVKIWLENPIWREIMGEACKTLNQLSKE